MYGLSKYRVAGGSLAGFMFLCLMLSFPGTVRGGGSLCVEAEDADLIYRSNIDSNHAGFTGRGFINFLNESGSYIEWHLELPEEGDYRVEATFANGGTARTIDILVNGVTFIPGFSFPSTNTWPNWKTTGFDLHFSAGMNTLRLVSANPDGGPNIDRICLSSPEIDLNIAPVAADDTITVSLRQQALILVLENDYDLNGDPLTVDWYSLPESGNLRLETGGRSFLYTPDTAFTGQLSISYVVTDGLKSDTGRVLIRIENIDWSVAVADMILATRTPSTVGSWNYTVGLMLEGILRVYKRTGKTAYLDFIRDWGMLHVSANGVVDAELISLDNMMSGFLILHLYQETGIDRFKKAAEYVRGNFDSYPRTSDGGFWHKKNLNGELWLDGLYMGMPFLAAYGNLFDDKEYAREEVVRQFSVYLGHLMNEETNLPVHGYDEDGSAGWSRSALKRSPYHWGRSIGWVVMALSELLDMIPEGYPGRELLTGYYRQILLGLVPFQDPGTGLWYQVVDRRNDPGNWPETSCSMMYTLSLYRAVGLGILDSTYLENVGRGYGGVLSRVTRGSGGMVYLTGICEGTGVSSDISYYYNRARNTNDNHGLGSFLIMNEMVAYNNLPWSEPLTAMSDRVSAVNARSRLFPNPCSDRLWFDLSGFESAAEVDVWSVTGLHQSHTFFSSGRQLAGIPVSGLPPGVYLCRIRAGNHVKTYRFVKKR